MVCNEPLNARRGTRCRWPIRFNFRDSAVSVHRRRGLGVTIAGCSVTDGKVTRASKCRLLRDNIVVHTGSVGSLRRFKDNVREVQSGYECGIGIERYNDLKPGDVIECYKLEEVKRSLAESAAIVVPEPDAAE
jgi:translation initiation factor IF-2